MAGKIPLSKLRSKIIKMTTQEKPKDGTTGRPEVLQRCWELIIHRVWREATETSPDITSNADFEEKLHDVVGLYLSPPVVLC